MNALAQALTRDSTTTLTENGDKTYSTSLDACVDLFFKVGAVRGQGAGRVTSLFDAAYAQDPDLASRIMLWARDVRGGAGERQVFRDVLVHLERRDPTRLARVLPSVPAVGRWDDLFALTSEAGKTAAYAMFAYALHDGQGLAAKWAPRESSKNRAFAKGLREFMGLTPRDYRKMVSRLSDTVEQKMCSRDWSAIEFSRVPSVAAARYSNAFLKRQPERYAEFTAAALRGEEKINAGALFPYDVTKSSVDRATADALWASLPDYVPEGVSFLPVVDVSGSMTSMVGSSGVSCLDVAVSLGIYLAERNKSAFEGLGVTFTSVPTLFRVPKTSSIRDRVNYVTGRDWGMSTDLDAAMQLIVTTAVENDVPASDVPKFLIVISDMEFDSGCEHGKTSASERTKSYFEAAGYDVPGIVWWNVESRGDTTPVRYDESGMVLVSGLSPAVVKSVLGGDVNPVSAMLKTVMVERYDH